jgi:hypothetical protein
MHAQALIAPAAPRGEWDLNRLVHNERRAVAHVQPFSPGMGDTLATGSLDDSGARFVRPQGFGEHLDSLAQIDWDVVDLLGTLRQQFARPRWRGKPAGVRPSVSGCGAAPASLQPVSMLSIWESTPMMSVNGSHFGATSL